MFLFPTKTDVWGLVVNEAMANKCVVVSSPYAGCVEDLLFTKNTGYVLELKNDIWSKCVIELLENDDLIENIIINASDIIKDYTMNKSESKFISIFKANV